MNNYNNYKWQQKQQQFQQQQKKKAIQQSTPVATRPSITLTIDMRKNKPVSGDIILVDNAGGVTKGDGFVIDMITEDTCFDPVLIRKYANGENNDENNYKVIIELTHRLYRLRMIGGKIKCVGYSANFADIIQNVDRETFFDEMNIRQTTLQRQRKIDKILE